MTSMSTDELFDTLGFSWDRQRVPVISSPQDVERAVWRYVRSLPEFVWDAAQLEGNPFTYPEVQTLLDGTTVGGRKISDERQVLNLAESSRRLAVMVRERTFRLDKATSDELHDLIASGEAFDAGMFRGEGSERMTPSVFLGEHGRHVPPETEPGGANLRTLHAAGVAAIIDGIEAVFEQAVVYCLFACRNQFYFDANKRTSRAMMNGHLMSHGIDAISVPAARRLDYNTAMIDFYRGADATRMIELFAEWCPGNPALTPAPGLVARAPEPPPLPPEAPGLSR
jgi:hypothetical protein